ncbi:hypothetical protein BofuT4_P034480.1 [Botrytis cinerea T4]|uniref:Uncharacterized protein n=1 Tax=Botryotinia fuckeliana (strain T4) TaxID=999810 RepID=G2Y878_BOTF4|nr:hypothetical protein BofuT4_P034480.1 [Botrytis cinerea T4]
MLSRSNSTRIPGLRCTLIANNTPLKQASRQVTIKLLQGFYPKQTNDKGFNAEEDLVLGRGWRYVQIKATKTSLSWFLRLVSYQRDENQLVVGTQSIVGI